MVENEIYTGAGLSATMIPEIDLELSELVNTPTNNVNLLATTNSQKTLTWTVGTNTRLVPSIYKGCIATLSRYNSSGVAQNETLHLVIKDNTENTIVFNQALSSTASDLFTCKILAYGAPCPAPSETTITGSGLTSISVTNDGAGIPFAASQALSFSGGGGSGAAATYQLTKDKHEITCTAETGTNYDGKWIKIESAAATIVKYVFWFDIDDGGATVPGHGVSGSTNVEINTISSSDAAGTVATEIATVINAQVGLTATADGSKITVECDNGGAVGAVTQAGTPPLTVVQLVEGGEISGTTITAAGSGYSSITIANVTTGTTNATFSGTVGTTTAPNLLADNWLGLVNTITPPSVDAEMKQLNMALGGTRNFNYQYKGAETVGNASFDVSMNNGSWLYYALGKMTYNAPTVDTDVDLADNTADKSNFTFAHNGSHTGGKNIYRVINGQEYPPLPASETPGDYHKVEDYISYDFQENDTGDLPSFALEVTAEKGNIAYGTQDSTDDFRRHFTKIYTGLQVNTFTLSFEEGMEVKATVDAVCRKAHDAGDNYIPKRNVTTPSSLYNHTVSGLSTALTTEDTKPFMFSDGSIKAFGQTLGRVKSGTLTITNNLTPQRYIGNYDRTITSAHTAGQRQYELSLNLMITDKVLWTELRGQNEYSATNELIELSFEKDGVSNDSFTIKLDDYMLTTMDIPFPDDKGPLEVAITAQARTLNDCTYTGKWVIQG